MYFIKDKFFINFIDQLIYYLITSLLNNILNDLEVYKYPAHKAPTFPKTNKTIYPGPKK